MASLAPPMAWRTAPEGSIRLVQVSDFHLLDSHQQRFAGILPEETLVATLNAVGDWQPDLVVATGDLVHEGNLATYQRLRALLSPLDCPVICLPGNHDRVEHLLTICSTPPLSNNPYQRFGAWGLGLIDTTQPGEEAGTITPAALGDLERLILAEPCEHLLLALHHQPQPVGSPWLDAIGLTDSQPLWEFCSQMPHLRGVLFGHVHQCVDTLYMGVRLLGTPSTAVQFVLGSAKSQHDPNAPPGFRWLLLQPDGRLQTDTTYI